ncbi:MAG: efflux transporter outer membrane subunit [Proteobacteria bacterium]|nr:efflux transporter outer membrane subunit [Pseudomonadota bacterium]MCL2307556.1 efflux transporter outer membrane subunit [Pseudomonadota bacterium]
MRQIKSIFKNNKCWWVLPTLFLTGCMVGPDYVRPSFDIPAAYSEPAEGWKHARPSDGQLDTIWWTAYGDETVNRLMNEIDLDNQNLKAAEARYRQAQALLRVSTASLFPTLNANASTGRAQSANPGGSAPRAPSNQYNFSLNAAWDIDVWGSVRRSIEAQAAHVQVSEAQLAALRLSTQTALLQTYVALRVSDAQQKLMMETVEAYTRSLEMTQNRYQAGIITRADVAQAQTQLESARTRLINLEIDRVQSKNALALLVGKAPSQLSIEQIDTLPLTLPDIPVAVPSEWLERRPDIAAAERRVAAANAGIGVAQAAFYPSLTLSASGGYQANHWSDWFDVPGRVWSLGAGLAQFIFDGGRRSAMKDSAVAAYDATVADYKQTVLIAFQEVENQLTALRVLDDEWRSQQAALSAARDTETLILNQYKAGTTTYLNVVIAQTARLTAENNAIQLRGRQLAASVALINALGGGWPGIRD